MKDKKTVQGFVNVLIFIEQHEVSKLNDSNQLNSQEYQALHDIKGFIGNLLGEELQCYDKRKKVHKQ